MSNYSGQMTGLFEDDRLLPILAVLSERLSCSTARARCVFITLFAAAHGVASLLANNALEYDEEQSIAILNAEEPCGDLLRTEISNRAAAWPPILKGLRL